MNERSSRDDRPERKDAGTRIDDPVVSQGESEDVAGVAAEEQVPGRTGDAMGGAMPRPRAETAREAADAVGEAQMTGAQNAEAQNAEAQNAEAQISEAKHDIAPGGTIETGLTPSGMESMVASQLLWDGASATSRIDRSIAEAAAESDPDRAAGGEGVAGGEGAAGPGGGSG